MFLKRIRVPVNGKAAHVLDAGQVHPDGAGATASGGGLSGRASVGRASRLGECRTDRQSSSRTQATAFRHGEIKRTGTGEDRSLCSQGSCGAYPRLRGGLSGADLMAGFETRQTLGTKHPQEPRRHTLVGGGSHSHPGPFLRAVERTAHRGHLVRAHGVG